jgi:hypothetical protein
VLVDPTAPIQRPSPHGYTGRLLTITEQQQLLDRWSRTDIDPRERVVGLLCLLHAASNAEVRGIRIQDLDLEVASVRLGRRPYPVPLDPLTLEAIRACLRQRAQTTTLNPYLLITHTNRSHDRPCSVAFPLNLLAKVALTTKVLRQTRLADLASRTDPPRGRRRARPHPRSRAALPRRRRRPPSRCARPDHPELYERAATELDTAAAHCRVAAAHLRDREIPGGAAHGWAAHGHDLAAQELLNAAARLHATRSLPER